MSDTASAPPQDAGREAEIQRVLEERAEILARPADAGDSREPVIEMLVLLVGVERYGIAVHRVREVRPLGTPSAVPGLPSRWAGLLNLRGALLPVLDLRLFLGVEESVFSDPPQAVVVSGPEVEAALKVDAVQGVERFKASDISPSPGGTSSVVLGVTTDLVSVLDVDRLLADEALLVNDGGAAAAIESDHPQCHPWTAGHQADRSVRHRSGSDCRCRMGRAGRGQPGQQDDGSDRSSEP
jgi:purine-binding chemotaxis protein CheW